MRDAARQAAFDALRSVDERDAYVNLLLPELLRERRVDARTAAFVTELVHGTLRWRGTYDAIIDHLAPGRAIEPAVRDVGDPRRGPVAAAARARPCRRVHVG